MLLLWIMHRGVSTECLTLTKEFDFSTTDILDHNFSFSKMTDQQIAEKKQEFEEYQAQKATPKTVAKESAPLPVINKRPAGKPVFKPKMPKKK